MSCSVPVAAYSPTPLTFPRNSNRHLPDGATLCPIIARSDVPERHHHGSLMTLIDHSS